MDGSFGTAQENFWAGEFGNEYTSRNQGLELEASKRWLFSRALRSAGTIGSVLELGANRGLNLTALRSLYPGIACQGVEINSRAADELRKEIGAENVFQESLLGFNPDSRQWDLVLLKGVLIHQAPEALPEAYRVIRNASRRFIMLAEYYSPFPEEVEYRGHQGRLFKRDFAGEMMDTYPELSLRDYGFAYQRDPVAPQGDFTWFLLEITPE